MIPEEVPSTSAQASDAPPHPRRRKRTDDGKAFGCAVNTPVANRPRLWMISSAALAIILVSYLRSVGPLTSQDTLMKAHGRAKTVTLRTAYSGVEVDRGEVWLLNRHETRRRRRQSPARTGRSSLPIRGVARDCGHHCTMRLHAGNLANGTGRDVRVHFTRWKVLPSPHDSETRDVHQDQFVPLIEHIEADNSTYVRPSRVSPDCFYSARFGTLALPEGAFIVEPLEAHAATTSTDRRRRRRSVDLREHLVYKAESPRFEPPVKGDGHNNEQHSQGANYSFAFEFADAARPRHGRSRRSANSWDHYVEVLVVADLKMLQYHKQDLENYVLTLFATVASIYRHPSLRASVNIVVVRLITLRDENGLRISNRAQETLQQFCSWQQSLNDMNDESPQHYDVAILLTRHDICRATNKCDTLGLAELGTMCDRRRSCAIIEDNGLSAAFTIAHELGHIFNIPHDDERKCGEYMPLTKNNFHIMAPTLEYNTNPWSWSPCSAAMIGKFLDYHRGQTQCILDPPMVRTYYKEMFENPSPGAVYSVNQQCQFVFGPSAEICPYMPTCRRLWCSTYYGYQMGCRTQHMPWADGTPCGDSMWCHRGQCIGMAPNQREKVNGGWGEWKPYGECSRTCGGGIQKGLRDCDNPRPQNGGRYCIGERERYRSCNMIECPWDTPGFREVQCAEFDGRDVGIHGVPKETKWVPKYAGISENERCKLYCRVSDSAAFYLLKETVIDGTSCDRNSDDICIDNTCHKAGCDHILGSNMTRDVCGICGGDGSTCRTVQGVFNERGSFGYNEVLKIPAGSANIDISQRAYNGQKDDDNYLALRSATGEFLLNGHYQVSVFRQQVSILDTVLEYSGSDTAMERINGTGPIRTDIYVNVLSVGTLNLPNIRYKYMLPVPGRDRSREQQPRATFYWQPADRWTECTSKCQGSQTQIFVCINAVTNREVHESHCVARKPDVRQRACNVDCFIKWTTRDASTCSARCGHGEKHQKVFCIRLYTSGREENADEQECIALKKPPLRMPCFSDCSNGRKWLYGDWSRCSESCGLSGLSRREAFCSDDGKRHIDARYCDSIPKEATETECNRTPCPQWAYGHWSECSRSCGGGIRNRHAMCRDVAARELHPQMCNEKEKHDIEKCNEHSCTGWRFGTWSVCSVSCGEGEQTREAHCGDSDGRLLEDGRCDLTERIVRKTCKQAGCPRWKLSSWSTCSVSCNEGFQTRSVTCVDSNDRRLDDRHCATAANIRPPTHMPCDNGPCPSWRAAEWSRCSVSCGSGTRDRDVDCIFNEQIVDASLCSEGQKPLRTERCTLLACAHWDVEQWGQCSITCGSGVQTRAVKCVRGSKKSAANDRECPGHKPRTERSCERQCDSRQGDNRSAEGRQSTAYWSVGPWGECSTSCGNGTQRRLVRCRDQYRELHDNYCSHAEREPSVRPCQVQSCGTWRTGEWEPCSATCGAYIVQQRSVTCEPANAAPNTKFVLDETNCDLLHRPEPSRNCHLPACPREPQLVIGEWKTGTWSQCSTSCGEGWRRRSVYCSAEVCRDDSKPVEFEQCNKGVCKKAYWQCSVTCGSDGEQKREVWCQADANSLGILPDADCDRSERPSSRRGCALSPCPPVINSAKYKSNSLDQLTSYNWRPGMWSTCKQNATKSCRGSRTRRVECVDSVGHVAVDSKCNITARPPNDQLCRISSCARWHKETWSSCSTTCGPGISKREVYCKRGRRQKVPESECFSVAKPYETKKCEMAKCSTYSWKVTPWSRCVDPCKPSEQYRKVYCMSKDKRAAAKMCQNTFAITDKVGQGNFAFAKLFAFTDDGNTYRFAKRSSESPALGTFAYADARSRLPKTHPGNNEFAFAFAKRAKFARRFAFDDVEVDDPTFAKFAKRDVKVIVPSKGLSTGFA
ncbi:A disintegrin and metalloproteinase with thrombospondin motifs 9-like protein [Aphelenchoides avenae]|nr:A disintegrin and metalloproteinase with thrombospondin motifs 9-like protein [Aphelenchus avenae]